MRKIKFNPEVGETHSSLEIIKVIGLVKSRMQVLVKCTCGAKKVVRYGNLRTGSTKSCGCKKKEMLSKSRMKHGFKKHDLYPVWTGMNYRCHNKNCHAYHNYGGRGISVCDRWRDSPENFINDMGDRPPGYDIDRIDNNGDYCPENCHWVTRKENTENTRRNVHLTANGETKLLTHWAEELEVVQSMVTYHLKKGRDFQWVHDHFSKKQALTKADA